MKGNHAMLITGAVDGLTHAELAKRTGLSVSTVKRRLEDPEIRRQIQEQRSKQLEMTTSRTQALREAAISRLAELMNSAAEPIALKAANSLLAVDARYQELRALDKRHESLQAELDQLRETAQAIADYAERPGYRSFSEQQAGSW